jgi:hypothetical protein
LVVVKTAISGSNTMVVTIMLSTNNKYEDCYLYKFQEKSGLEGHATGFDNKK